MPDATQPKAGAVLSDFEIARRLVKPSGSAERLVVTPLINASQQLRPSSLDLRLGSEFLIYTRTQFGLIDPANDKNTVQKQIERYSQKIVLGRGEKLVLHPNEFALGITLEFLRLPRDLVGRLEGRSTWARIGLQVHATAGFVDPGFSGRLTYELVNTGTIPIALYPGMRMGQMSFFQSNPVLIAYGERESDKYHSKLEPTPSWFYKDIEFEKIRLLKDEKLEEPHSE
ncbi:MAG: dCTP deaminase [Thermoleophilia bacterium]